MLVVNHYFVSSFKDMTRWENCTWKLFNCKLKIHVYRGFVDMTHHDNWCRYIFDKWRTKEIILRNNLAPNGGMSFYILSNSFINTVPTCKCIFCQLYCVLGHHIAPQILLRYSFSSVSSTNSLFFFHNYQKHMDGKIAGKPRIPHADD